MENAKILGSGTIAGGFYEEIKVTGVGTITGETHCKKMTIMGKAKVLNKMYIEESTYISGSVAFSSDVEALKIEVSGKMTCDGHVEADDVLVTGSCKADSVSATTMKICGGCSSKEVNVEILEIEGRRFEIEKAYADKVTIKPKGIKFPFSKENKAKIEYLECNEIDADVLNCKKLFAKNVKLGSDCIVDYIEYSNQADIDSKAVVREIIKVEE